MLMKVTISGVGASIKAISLGANLFTGCYLEFKPNAASSTTHILSVGDYLSLGGKQGTLFAGHVQTDFFPVDEARYPWVKGLNNLTGKEIGVVVSRPLFGRGEVNIKLTRISQEKDVDTLMYKEGIAASGGQLADTMVKGIARKIPLKIPATTATP